MHRINGAMGEETKAAAGTQTVVGGATGDAQAAGGDSKVDAKATDITKAEGDKGGETKPDAKATETKPAELELKVPEGIAVDEAGLGAFKALAKESGLDSAKAQKFLDLFAGAEQARAAKVDADLAGWNEALKTDKEFGGEKLELTKKLVGKAMAKYGSADLRERLNATGLGSHPDIVRAFRALGEKLSEDSVSGTSGGSGPTTRSKEEMLRERYPNSPELFSS